MKKQHTSVFFEEAVSELNIQPGEKYIDATYGEGGHARKIFELGGLLLAIDADSAQVKKSDDNILVVHGNFSEIESIAQNHGFTFVSGILFDFGLSMGQIREGGKGLSFEKPLEILDMRLGDGISVAEYLATVDHQSLTHALMKYSEDINSPQIANKIIQSRSRKKVQTVQDLKEIIDSVVHADMTTQKKSYARIFQALRIIVNDELENIKKALQGAVNIVKPGGVIVVITFHSLEDRIVKSFARNNKNALTEKIVDVGKMRTLASFERSATLRVLKKI